MGWRVGGCSPIFITVLISLWIALFNSKKKRKTKQNKTSQTIATNVRNKGNAMKTKKPFLFMDWVVCQNATQWMVRAVEWHRWLSDKTIRYRWDVVWIFITCAPVRTTVRTDNLRTASTIRIIQLYENPPCTPIFHFQSTNWAYGHYDVPVPLVLLSGACRFFMNVITKKTTNPYWCRLVTVRLCNHVIKN